MGVTYLEKPEEERSNSTTKEPSCYYLWIWHNSRDRRKKGGKEEGDDKGGTERKEKKPQQPKVLLFMWGFGMVGASEAEGVEDYVAFHVEGEADVLSFKVQEIQVGYDEVGVLLGCCCCGAAEAP